MGPFRNMVEKLVLAFILLPAIFCDVQPPALNPGILTQGNTIGDCQACRLFVDSFKKGLERTARGKYEGGDAAWEEEKLKTSYRRSEMRLIDIQDGVCKEESKHSVQCHHMAEKAEELIEKWWAQNPDESDDLYTYICIDSMKVCCPKHHYGKYCTPCPKDHNNVICRGNGKCRGDGTRKGNGTCLCDKGYEGTKCEICSYNYYMSHQEPDKNVCSPCHSSCMGCRAGTNKDCMVCKPGFAFDPDEGCQDINECDEFDTCKKDEFCLNSLGSYLCAKCSKACQGCHGDGPDMCRKCAEGFSRKGEFCIPDREDEFEQSEKLTSARFMTYVGLLIATIILLPRSATLGTMVGAMVLAYIVGAEYYCMINGHSGLVNLKELSISELFSL